MIKMKMVCPNCESQNVLRDAFASWDFEKQEWVLASVYDDFVCNDCGHATKEIDEEKED